MTIRKAGCKNITYQRFKISYDRWRIKNYINPKSSLGIHFSALVGAIGSYTIQPKICKRYLVVFQVQIMNGSIHGKL